MIVVEMKVTAYVQEGFDVKEAVSEFLLDDDRVSYCDVDTVSEKSTSKTFPEDDKRETDDRKEPGRTIKITDFEKMKKAERHARISGPLMKLLNERWGASNENDPAFIQTVNRVQAVSQELLDLISAGLL